MTKYVNFDISLSTGNDAVQIKPLQEIARILTGILDELYRHPATTKYERSLFDINGNRIGSATLEIVEDDEE